VKAPAAPPLDERRTAEFAAELRERARAWIPSWGLADGERDFGRALLDVAARFSSEVAERLDRAGEKMRRGFLDWLAVRGEAARPARMPVVFKMAATAREPVLAEAPVRMQVDAGGATVVFETETDVRLLPGRLEVVVGVDADADAVYLPPPGLNDVEPLEPLPSQWQLKSFAAAGAKTLQLDPETGLAGGMVLEAGGQQYRVEKVDKEIVTIDPPLAGDLPALAVAHKVSSFAPFDGVTRNRQEHALYLGHLELLDIEAAATMAVVGAQSLATGVTWQYWGKVDGRDEVGWQPLALAPDEEQQSDALVLTKPKGAIEPREIAGKNSRWIRGFTKNVPAGQAPFQPSELALRINAAGCGKAVPCPPGDEEAPSPAAEGMANTTPLVLESIFFPLGREPRQFDAFYLGSTEAFSKKGADVQLCFEMADPTFASLARVRTGQWPNTVAGVGADRELHLLEFNPSTRRLDKFRNREPLQPPSPGFNGQAARLNPVPLDIKPKWRLPMWMQGVDFLVGTTAGANVWLWHEKFFDPLNSGWIEFGQVPGATQLSTAPIDALVYLEGAPSKLVGLREGKLAVRDWPNGLNWAPVPTPVALESIVPVLGDNGFGQLVTSDAAGMLGISAKKLYHVKSDGTCTLLSSVNFDVAVAPAAVMAGTSLAFVAVEDGTGQLIAHHPSITAPSPPDLGTNAFVVGAIEVVLRGTDFHFLVAVTGGDVDYLGSWAPFSTTVTPTFFFQAPIPGSVHQLGGGPTALDQDVLIPGEHADIFLAAFDPSNRFPENETLHPGIVLPDSVPALVPGDVVAMVDGAAPEFRMIVAAPPSATRSGEVFYPINTAFSATASGPLLAFPIISNSLNGTVSGGNTLALDFSDLSSPPGPWLFVQSDLHQVVTVSGSSVTLSPPPLNNVPTTYAEPIPTNGRTAPFMDLTAATGNWDAAILERVKLAFPNADPDRQWAKAFTFAGNQPRLVALAGEFVTPPSGTPTFIADGATGEWTRLLGDTSSNPELSWEYWNGKGWWKLDVDLDETLNLKSSGALQFEVPGDIAPTDWSGKTNYWIRARLVGGDYGKEQVTVTTTPTSVPGQTQQTIDRSSAGIRAPSVVKLHIAYRLCKGVRPAFVLAQDSGSMRDQSDANRTPGAIVEAFVPLAVTLGRLSNPAPSLVPPEECPPPCPYPSAPPSAAAAPSIAAAAPPAAALRQATGRALYVGLNAAPSGAPVKVLLLVDKEAPHEPFAPMKIEALVADRFMPVVAEDTTRALGESGLLSMAFGAAPAPHELFGVDNLTWLRLMPGGSGPASEWRPALRGAYLNAVWASAAETLTRELLGSSEGEPDLTLHLARPPVLRDSLELRVREPLGDEEREALRAEDENRVASDVDGLPGDWVLWQRVTDPGDEPPAARVYALDEATGEVRFGDGQHGMIPPIGRDSIVAFRYKRTEIGSSGDGNVPANGIGPRIALNLVSPVESVEAVFAADQAAGGAPPESDERVVRFGTARLRHRNRAVTARDFEDLAMESSPDIVQARCFARRSHVWLVVVMRGSDPLPNAAEVRELRRLLLAAAPASLGTPGALRITGPRVRRLRVALMLRVASLDVAGDVARSVQQRVEALFDTAAGGADDDGWPLGAEPKGEDLALAVIGTRHLESLGGVTLLEVLPDGSERLWPDAVKRDELVMLDKDAVRLEFETVEVIS
jgi:hypothetical protein